MSKKNVGAVHSRKPKDKESSHEIQWSSAKSVYAGTTYHLKKNFNGICFAS